MSKSNPIWRKKTVYTTGSFADDHGIFYTIESCGSHWEIRRKGRGPTNKVVETFVDVVDTLREAKAKVQLNFERWLNDEECEDGV